MTYPIEDTDFSESEQAESFQIKLPGGLWLEMADSWANRRGLMVFLRCLRSPEGRPLMTLEQIAGQLGYADRRNVHNFWMEFQACGEDLDAFLSRRKKVDGEVLGLCEQIWRAHPLWSAVEVHAELVRRFPQKGSALSEQNVRTAGHQIGFLGIQQVLRRQLAQGEAHYQEPFVIQALFGLAQVGAEVQAAGAQEVACLPEVLETIPPQSVLPQPSVSAAEETAEKLEASLLEGEASRSALRRLWEGDTGTRVLMLVLYFHGLSLEVIGSFFGVHKTTVMRWLAPFAHLNWQEVVAQGKRFFSGILAVDEKWIKIDGVWWYLFVAVDHVSGLPLLVALFPSNGKEYCQAFLLQIKALGYIPKVIITDGWDAYVEAIATVFPAAEHLLCRFHALKSAFRRLKRSIPDWKGRSVWVKKLKTLFHTPSKRTVQRRVDKLQTQAEHTPAKGVFDSLLAKLPKLLPAVGSTFRPSTSNAAERFLGAFDRFYRLKGPFQNEASARKHIKLFILGYVFCALSSQAQAEKQGRCPLQLAGYQVAHLPFFHMFNRPDLSVVQKRLAHTYAQVA